MVYSSNKNIFGVDIGDQALRLVQLEKIGKLIHLRSYNEVIIPSTIVNNGKVENEEKLSKLFSQLAKTAQGKKINTKNIITVLPESKTFIKVIEVDNVNGYNKTNIKPIIEEEIKRHVPMLLEEIYLDWQILSETSSSIKIVIGAVPKNIVDYYLAIIERSGLIPYVFEVEAAAITRCLIPKNDTTQQARIIIDFGAVRTGLILYDHKTVQFTISLPISGNKITETIAQTLKIDLEKAEKAKIVCGLDSQKCEGALLKILLEPIDALTEEIKKAITFYQNNFKGINQISEIILCGGGANFSNIDKILNEKLNIPVKIGNPFTNISQTKKIAFPSNKILSYTTAIGLALRVFEKKNLI